MGNENYSKLSVKVHIFWEGLRFVLYVETVKSTLEILQNFAAFSEYMNFNKIFLYVFKIIQVNECQDKLSCSEAKKINFTIDFVFIKNTLYNFSCIYVSKAKLFFLIGMY